MVIGNDGNAGNASIIMIRCGAWSDPLGMVVWFGGLHRKVVVVAVIDIVFVVVGHGVGGAVAASNFCAAAVIYTCI